MGKLTELEQWEDDVYQIETSDPVLGGPDGVSNRPQKQLANRTQWLKKQIEQANNDLADHIRSRNHPDATLTDKGFVRLYSGVTSLDETMAATPKAVKIAMDNANERLAKARNLSDLQSVPQALQALTIATTKKAVEDTQIGLDRQPVMLISTADDLSNLPAGARRFARNNTGVTVLPTDNNCYIEVVAKRDSQNGGCVKVVDHDNPGNAWTGIRNNVPADAGFTWVQQYNESHRPPQQEIPDMPDALIRGNNLSDLTDPSEAVQYLGLTETVSKAAGAMQRDQNGADIPDKPLFVKTLGIVDSYPVGCPIPYPGPVAPDGYLLMDGRSFSKTLYPQLAKFYVAGVLPDMRGMYVRGWTASYSPKSIDTPQGMNGAYNSVGIIPYDYGSTRIINGKHPFAATERTKTLMPGAVSPRGYDIYQLQRSDRFEAFEGGGRQLLSTQYYERLIENPDYKDNPPQPQTAMIVNKDSKYNDSYNGWDFYELPTDEKLKSVTFKIVRGLTPVGSIDSTWNRINLDSKEIIDDVAPYRLIEKKLMPIGVPNVAFNYITKAA
ncbi:tail fiber protein [Salmonella enterica]|nr:tail fiber protein [Salmonella enterica]